MTQLHTVEIVCGQDFAFGKDSKGNLNWLIDLTNEFAVKLEIVRPLKIAGKQISSSKIRSLIKIGDIETALRLLGRNYSFTGLPFKEKGMGKKLGFPTINLKTDKERALPKGVFVSLAIRNKTIYPAITNIGNRPSFNLGKTIVPETHLLRFNGTWKKSLTKIILLKKIRNERKFASVELLKKPLEKDKNAAEKFFNL